MLSPSTTQGLTASPGGAGCPHTPSCFQKLGFTRSTKPGGRAALQQFPPRPAPYLEISSRQELVSAGFSLFTTQARADTTPAVSSFRTRRFTKSGLSYPRGRTTTHFGTSTQPATAAAT